jgi:hypothetical protein
MRLGKKRAPAPPPEPPTATTKPPWHEFVDQEERPSREDLAGAHSPFESILEPVPMPRWLRGRRRAPRDKISDKKTPH